MNLTSRYAVKSDCKKSLASWQIPDEWWSRQAEYPWCAQFVKPDNMVADLACGVPHFFKYFLAKHAKMVYAIDIDPAITQVANPYTNLELISSDVCSIPQIKDESMDIAYCISVLEHMEPDARRLALKEMRRITKPGGLIVVTFDVPKVTPDEYGQLATELNLQWAGLVNMTRPTDALHSDLFNVDVFMSVVRKPE